MRYLIAFLISLFSILGAEEKRDVATLPEGRVHEGDYFVSGDHVRILGVVTGDVYVLGSLVNIGGRVEGDVIATGGTIELTGEVLGDARLAGAQITLKGTINQNCTALGGNIQMAPPAKINGSGVFMGGQVDLSGEIKGRARITASSAQLLGKIGKESKINVGQLHIGPSAVIEGDVEYSSGKEAVIDPGARINGNLIFSPSAVKELFAGKWKETLIFSSKFIPTLMNFIFSFVIGLFSIKLFHHRLEAALGVLKHHRLKALGVGLLVLILLPLAALLLLITILGFPIAVALVAFSLITFYSAKIIPILWLSNAIFTKIGFKRNSVPIFTVGLVVFFLLLQIPVVGGIISIIFILLGLGAGALSRTKRIGT